MELVTCELLRTYNCGNHSGRGTHRRRLPHSGHCHCSPETTTPSGPLPVAVEPEIGVSVPLIPTIAAPARFCVLNAVYTNEPEASTAILRGPFPVPSESAGVIAVSFPVTASMVNSSIVPRPAHVIYAAAALAPVARLGCELTASRDQAHNSAHRSW